MDLVGHRGAIVAFCCSTSALNCIVISSALGYPLPIVERVLSISRRRLRFMQLRRPIPSWADPPLFRLQTPPPSVLVKMSVTAAKLLDDLHKQKVRDFVNRPLSPPDSEDEYVDVVSLTSLRAPCAYWSNRLPDSTLECPPRIYRPTPLDRPPPNRESAPQRDPAPWVPTRTPWLPNSQRFHYRMDQGILCDYYQIEFGLLSSALSPRKIWPLARSFVSDGNAAKSSTTVSDYLVLHLGALLTRSLY